MVSVGGGEVVLGALALRGGSRGRFRKMARLSAGLAEGDHPEARRRLERSSWGFWLIVLLLVAATWNMVLKPGL